MTTFDGEELTITLASGITTLDVQDDLYEPWKEWVLLDNAQYPAAFRPSGGDPLTPGISAGSYFFLQNNEGWRIKPAEEDASILVNGNLAPEDSTLPLVVPTDGDYTVLIAGLQPITQNVAELLTLQQDTSFEGSVSIDTVSGAPGTAYPLGTRTSPVDNLADALEIAARINVMRLDIHGSIALTQSFDGWDLHGGTIALNGQSVDGAEFRDCNISGTGSGSVFIADSTVGTVSGIGGTISDSIITETLTLGGHMRLIECASGVAGTSTPVLDLDAIAAVDVSVRAWSGGIEIRNVNDAGDNLSIDLLSGHAILASSCSDGTIVVRGVGHVTDNSTGATVVSLGMVEGIDTQDAARFAKNAFSSIWAKP